MLKGIYFDPKSNFAKLCEGVVVQPPPNQVIPHTHKLQVDKRRVLNLSTDIYSTSFFFFVSFFIRFFTKGLTILSSSGVEAATVAITAVLTSCGGFGMYCSMNLVFIQGYTFTTIFAFFMPNDTFQFKFVTIISNSLIF